MDVREMKAGRELDALIHFKVLKKNSAFLWDLNYSTDIRDAMKVFTHWGWQGMLGFSGTDWFCNIDYGFDKNGVMQNAEATAETAPLAICRAALLAKEETQ